MALDLCHTDHLTMPPPVRVAYCAIPHDNGAFTFYRALRSGLARHDIDLLCVSLGNEERARWNPAFADEGCRNVPVEGNDQRAASRALEQFCQAEEVKVLMPQHAPAALAALPHLPQDLRVVHACMDLFPEALLFYGELAPLVDRMVCATPRQRWELERRGVPPSRLATIPFAARIDEFQEPRGGRREAANGLRLAWVGRLNHLQKGAAWLPRILAQLDSQMSNWALDVVGEGQLRAQLERKLEPLIRAGKVTFHGKLAPKEVAAVLGAAHLYLLPTRYEGFGISIVEAMATGCVPVLSHIAGVTDFILGQPPCGQLCQLGDPTSFARAILELGRDPRALEARGKQAALAARARFSDEALGASYSSLLREVLQAPSKRPPPLAWSLFKARSTTYLRSWWPNRVAPGRLTRRLLDARERWLVRHPPPGLGRL